MNPRIHLPTSSKILCFLLLLIAWNVSAQSTKQVKTSSDEIEIRPIQQTAGVQPVKIKLANELATSSHERRIIIRLKSEALTQSTNPTNARRSLDREHDLFKEDFQRINQQGVARRSGVQSKILHEYKNTFNGFSLVTDSEVEQRIKELPYVASITEDKKVEAIDNISNEIIRADDVWSTYNITGRGVVIGIIDTGIDYTHPDLGGSMGPASKVIGGYDFVNEDNDPMDDHGHGTHVAGIAAANGTIKGVAPDAKLVGFKVLTADGWGYDSWILAAIERTVDPDQNPNTDDALDVVNMSLGRQTDANEPFSEAIANATLHGVTFVVAAGNAYDYQTVGTPGIAESAITVGATEMNDATAYFSSKGPTPDNFYIKPDVAAPGVSIYSTFPGSQYQSMSGTSMASPHVAGAVALLLEKHPSWSPAILKGALMNTAKASWENIWNQGAGRIDVLKAIEQEVVVTPGSISMGISAEGAGNWQKVTSVTITNFSSATKNIALAIEGNIVHPAIIHSISPSSFSLAPSQSRTVTVTSIVTPSQLPKLDLTEGYFGKLVASFGGSTVSTNIALANPKRLKINFTGELPNLVIAVGTDNNVWKPFYPTSSPVELVLPNGTYNLTSMYGAKHYNIKEGVSNGSTVTLSKSQASNQLVFHPKTEDGTRIKLENSFHTGTTTLTGYNIVTLDPYVRDTIFVSNSTSYKIEFHLTDTIKSKPNTFYSIAAVQQPGIFENKTLSNNPADYTKVNLTIPEAEQDFSMTYYMQSGIERSFEMVSPSTLFGRNPLVTNPLKVMISQDEVPIVRSFFLKFATNASTWETGGMKAMKPNQLGFYDRFLHPFDTVSNASEFDYNLGQSLLRWTGKLLAYPGQIYLTTDFPSSGLFRYHYNDLKKAPILYKLKSNNTIIKEGSFTNELYEEQYNSGDSRLIEVGDQSYELFLQYDGNNVGGTQGTAATTLNFNMQLDDKQPPHLEMLTLEVDGISVNHISTSAPATLRFTLTDDYCFGCGGGPVSGIQNSSLFIKKSGSAQWIQIPTQSSNGISHRATLYGFEDGLYDLKLTSTDNVGNTLKYELQPAFTVTANGSVIFDPVSLLAPADNATSVTTQPEFQWTTAPLSIYYTLQLSKASNFSSVEEEYTTSNTSFAIISELDYLTQYYWRVKANYAGGASAWSESFSFTTKEQPPVTLLVPTNLATNVAVTPEFQWTVASQAISYTLQLSKSLNFSEVEREHLVEGTSFTFTEPLDFLTTYYWRVRPNYTQGSGDWSSTFNFKTRGRPAVTLVEPVNQATDISIRPILSWTEASAAYYYRIQISKQSNFSNLAEDFYYWTNSLTLHTPLNYSTTYYWRVQTYYAEGPGDWSASFSFTTSNPPVYEIVSLLKPADALGNVPIVPQFEWTSSADAVSYTIQVSKKVNFSVVVIEYTTQDTTYLPGSYLDYSSVYLWRVRANYDLESGNWSTPNTFSTASRVATSLIAPANHAHDVSINPVFQWTGDPYVQAYVLQASLLADFSNIEREYNTPDTLYKFLQNFKLASKLYWRVQTYYYNGSSATSPTFQFDIIDGIVPLLTPANHFETTSTLIDFKWNKIEGMSLYHIEVSENSTFSPAKDAKLTADTVYSCPVPLTVNKKYYWRVRPFYVMGNGANLFGEWSGAFDFSIVKQSSQVVTGVDGKTETSNAYAYPNPFSSETQLVFNLSQPGEVAFEFSDVNGREVTAMTQYYAEAGKQFFTFQSTHEAFGSDGFYFCKIKSKEKIEVIKLMLKH